MFYAIRGTDVPNSLDKRKGARPAHIARLEKLRDAGRLLLSGPFPAIDAEDPGPAGYTGSLIVAEFASLAEARAWACRAAWGRTSLYSARNQRKAATNAGKLVGTPHQRRRSPTSSSCAKNSASHAGWCSVVRGAALSRWPMPRRIRNAAPG